MIKNLKKNEKGFTLVELVVVIAILAILAALLVPRIIGSVDSSKASRETANARTLASEISTKNALESLGGTLLIPAGKYDNGTNTPSAAVLTALGRVAADFPDSTYAQIAVDAEGNASVIINHSYSY